MENESEESLVLFHGERAVDTYHTFLVYSPKLTGMVVETRIINISRLGT